MSQDARVKRRLRRQRRKKAASLFATLIVLAGAFGAVTVGSSTLINWAEASEEFDIAAPTPVTAAPLDMAEGFAVTRRFVGQVEAASSANISFEMGECPPLNLT